MKVRAALARVVNPATGRNIVAEGMVQGLSATEAGVVRFTLDAGGTDPKAAEALLEAAKREASSVEGVARVVAFGTSHQTAPPPRGGHDNPMGLAKQARIGAAADYLPGVRNVIAVASGKGGVGKSTIAANLAVAFATAGLSTGLLDADIYGPSLPTLFGLKDRPAVRDGKVIPAEAFGVRAMSIGLLVDQNKALAWRGPMVMGAMRQLMSDVAWGPLDALVVDTPPGTGDVHLTLAQSKKVTGAVIVSTPQEMALADVRRGVELFRTVKVPILGVIENMAWIDLPGGGRQYVFGEGGAERAARELDAPFLGAVPLYQELREASDAGAPIVASAPDSPAAKAVVAIADRLRTTFTA
ncbi:MAG: Mrp/NBP35 family ATP-binding protein [Pseudomonadota bacterium]|nr:Mrp/NBP35 family ATP-binding protein [Pseudomonadota bacterium]